MKMFVYGTLKRGFYNNWLLKRATFLGEATTAPRFHLYSMGAYPVMVPGDLSVTGEVYEVGPEESAYIDAMELGAGYQRVAVSLSDGTEAAAYIYQGSVQGLRDVGGNWVKGDEYLDWNEDEEEDEEEDEDEDEESEKE